MGQTFFLNLFIYFWLCWVFVSVRGLSPVAASGGHSSSRCAGLSLSRPLLLWSTGSRCAGSVVVAHEPSCSVATGIFPDQGSNPCPLHWQADSQPLRHQGSPGPNILTDTSSEKAYRWQTSIWKDAPRHLLSGICRLKQGDAITHLSDGQNPEHWQHQMLLRIWNRNSHSLLLGMKTGTAMLEDSLVVSSKTKHTQTRLSISCAPWYSPKGVENVCPHKNLPLVVYSSFTIAKTWKEPRCPSVGEWRNKLWSVQTMGYYSVIKRNEL